MRSVGGGSLFEREHHREVAAVLESLNADLLVEHACLFGGGTAIVLTHGEYRESVDIDFLVSSLAGYRTLRQLVEMSLPADDGLAESIAAEANQALRPRL